MSHPDEHGRYAHRFLDRRCFLRAGALGCFGLNLAGLLQAKESGEERSVRTKSCILIFYYGGPSQLDTWDLKPQAPGEVRGEFRPISTRVPGIQICQHMPRTARITDKLAIVRGMHHPMRNHNSAAVESLCGRTPLKGDLELLADDPNSFPSYGSVLSHLLPRRHAVPMHVTLPHVMHNVVRLPGQTPGFLGAASGPFEVTRDPNQDGFQVGELALPADLPLSRLEDRQALLTRIDTQAARANALARTGALSVYQERAFNLLHSQKVRRAFDLSCEGPAVRERYGRTTLGQSLLLARRLVEAGVPFVNVNDKIHNGQLANWDSHENNFSRLKDDLLPPADLAYSALIEDLDGRGLLETTLVIALAEFGRTPKVNKQAGRDHWPDCFSIVLAGGGIKGGLVYGSSDRIGAYPATDAVTPGDLAATLFWRFGLDPMREIRDLTGRPYRLAEGEPLHKLFT